MVFCGDSGIDADFCLKLHPNYCIFEKRLCQFADNNGNCFSCEAPSDGEMTCNYNFVLGNK